MGDDGMNVITAEQMVAFTHAFSLLVLGFAFFAAYAGVMLAWASREFLLLYLRRSPRWRRFNRAMRRLFA